MPIRFSCPYCRQKLSVSTRKAGMKADCPRCKKSLRIPEPPRAEHGPTRADKPGPRTSAPTPVAPAAPSAPPVEPAGAPEDPLPAAPIAAPLAGPEPGPTADHPVDKEALSPPFEQHPEATFAPDAADFDGLELVYDTEPAPPSPRAVTADLVTIPRYAIYVQGGLLALVALVAFGIGILTGGALLTQPQERTAQACTITGSVMYAAGARQRPDDGAVIAILPQTGEKPDEKAPIEGLRPGDPTPDENHRGIAVLKAAGGAYARADANGRFELKVPDSGRYLVLAISNQKLLRSLDEINTADLFKIGPYFENAADLLGNHQYQIRLEQIRGDRELSVTFD